MAKSKMKKISVSITEADYAKLQVLSVGMGKTVQSVTKEGLHIWVGYLEKRFEENVKKAFEKMEADGVTVSFGGKQLGGKKDGNK